MAEALRGEGGGRGEDGRYYTVVLSRKDKDRYLVGLGVGSQGQRQSCWIRHCKRFEKMRQRAVKDNAIFSKDRVSLDRIS